MENDCSMAFIYLFIFKRKDKWAKAVLYIQDFMALFQQPSLEVQYRYLLNVHSMYFSGGITLWRVVDTLKAAFHSERSSKPLVFIFSFPTAPSNSADSISTFTPAQVLLTSHT